MTGQDYVIAACRDPQRLRELAGLLEARSAWPRVAFDGPAAVFVAAQDQVVSDPGSANLLLLGTVFARQGPIERCMMLDAQTLAELRGGSTQRLLRTYWGSYLAICTMDDELMVLRDPSAAMPCLYTKIPGGVLIASSLSVLQDTGLWQPCVSVKMVAEGLFRADLPTTQTALDHIAELAPGTALRIAPDGMSPFAIWSPWDHAAIDDGINSAEHVERLRRAVQNSAAAWASCARQILIGVSGGLDSSILAACLRHRSSRPVCVTLATSEAEGDERPFARAICDHLGLALVEAGYALTDIAIDRPARPHMPRPTGRIIAQGYNAAVSRVVAEQGGDAFFTGNGGDNVLGFSQSAGAIADRFLHEGLSPGLWATASEICQLTGCSLLAALRAALRTLCRSRRYQWRPDRRFLGRDVLGELEAKPLTHPWLEAPKGVLPGKAAHIASLLRIQRHLDGTGQLGQVAVINPLMSQPVVETCLAIPSWMWCQGGRDRSLAREAFRHDMPQRITDRVSKGGPDGFGTQILAHFHKQIRERLLEGVLASEGLLDRKALQQRLTGERPDWGPDQIRILELLEAEAWIAHWRSF